jgi:hypothetical protein
MPPYFCNCWRSRPISTFEFLIAFLSTAQALVYRAAPLHRPILAGVGPILLFVGHSTAIGLVLRWPSFCGSLLWMLGWLLFIFVT